MRVRVAGPAGEGLNEALVATGLDVASDAGPLVYVTLEGPGVEGIEDALAGWVAEARRAANDDADVVTVVGDDLIDGEDVAACAVGHGLVAGTRAFAMERDRSAGTGNVVVTDPGNLDAAAVTVAWLVKERVVSGEVLHTGRRRHGRQRL